MMIRRAFVALVLPLTLIACDPKSDFVEAANGSTVTCNLNPISAATTGAVETKGRLVAIAARPDGQPINNAAMTITIFGPGSFRDPVSGQDLRDGSGGLIKDFRTQGDAQGRVAIDVVCPEVGNAAAVGTFACVANVDIGVARCTSTFTTTRS